MAPILLLLLAVLVSAAAASPPPHTCSALGDPAANHHHPCPPFPSPPTTFPFSSSPGCNHPSFRIRCSSPYSLLSINSSPFLLLRFSNSSLTLSPSPKNSSGYDDCSILPSRPIDLSPSPFRLDPSTCPYLASLSPCRPHPRCHNLTTWQLRLFADPLLLFTNCSSFPRRPSHPSSCIPDSLTDFLRSGFTVHWNLSSDPYNSGCSRCLRVVDGVCGFNDSSPSKPFLCFPSLDRLHHHRNPHRFVLLLASLFAVVLVFVVLLSLWAARRRWRGIGSGGGGEPLALFLRRHHLHPPIYNYDQLRVATNDFDPRRKIGDGGFGSVFLAQLDDGHIAAVKRLHRQHPAASTKSFCNEILILSSLRHPNLVCLHGYCCDPRGLLLVYDYVPNGTLADHLHGSRSMYRKASLTWPVRVDVALQTAAALEYLHFSLKPPVVHRDITSNNIFVERDMRIKVGDFGLSRLLTLPDPNSADGATAGSASEYVCCTGPQGTPGYLDPDYHRSLRLTEKSDVYSFGVVLLELVTGMRAVDLRRDKREVSLADMVVLKIQVGMLHEVVDPVLVSQGEAMGTIEAVAELAFRCLAGEKDDRPDAREVVEELKRIKGQIQDAASRRP